MRKGVTCIAEKEGDHWVLTIAGKSIPHPVNSLPAAQRLADIYVDTCKIEWSPVP